MGNLLLTADGFKSLEQELKDLQTRVLPDIKVRMATARADGDLSENNAWITAKEEMEITRMRIAELKLQLKTATLVKESKNSNVVQVGDQVTIIMNGIKTTVSIVPTLEADPVNKKLSSDSPIGKAVVGQKVGTTVTVQTPAGETVAEIVKIG